jgi:hypothetical protein
MEERHNKYYVPVHGVYLVITKLKCIILTRSPVTLGDNINYEVS